MHRLTVDQLLEQSRRGLQRLQPDGAYARMKAGARMVDVRTADQIARDGRVPNALEISLNVLEWRLDPDSSSRHRRAPNLDDVVIILCHEGYCSSLAAARLQTLGFPAATDIEGGFRAWRECGMPVIRTGETWQPDGSPTVAAAGELAQGLRRITFQE